MLRMGSRVVLPLSITVSLMAQVRKANHQYLLIFIHSFVYSHVQNSLPNFQRLRQGSKQFLHRQST